MVKEVKGRLTEKELLQLSELTSIISNVDTDDAEEIESQEIILHMINQCKERNFSIDVLYENFAQKKVSIPDDIPIELQRHLQIMLSYAMNAIEQINE